MKKIGLTGGIGVGKTYVAQVFKNLDIPIFNADIQAKECLSNNIELIQAVKQEFGKKMYVNNILQKEILANIVFQDNIALEKLNLLVHPVVKSKFSLWCKEQNVKLIIKEAAILYESGSHLDLDAVICVSAPEDLRIKRIQERDGLLEEDIRHRMNNQMLQSEKEKLSDYIIYNDEKQLVLPQILKIIKEID